MFDYVAEHILVRPKGHRLTFRIVAVESVASRSEPPLLADSALFCHSPDYRFQFVLSLKLVHRSFLQFVAADMGYLDREISCYWQVLLFIELRRAVKSSFRCHPGSESLEFVSPSFSRFVQIEVDGYFPVRIDRFGT